MLFTFFVLFFFYSAQLGCNHNLLSVSYLGACVCAVCVYVSSVFIIDIADKLLGSDWMCLMSCRCKSQQMKMGFCIHTTVEMPYRWRQMGGVSYCLANIHSLSNNTHTHPCLPPPLSLWFDKIVKSHIARYFAICHPVIASVTQHPIAIHTIL